MIFLKIYFRTCSKILLNHTNESYKNMAIKQRDGSYAVVLDAAITTPQELKKIAEVLEKYGVSLIKFSESQRMVIVGVDPEKVEEMCNEMGVKLANAVGRVVRSIKFCPGNTLCVMGLQNTIEMAQKLKKFDGMELPGKLKIAIAGCSNSCTEPAVRDIGLMGTKDGYTIFVGGSAGRKPRIGYVLAEKVSPEDAEKLVEKIIEFYKANAKNGQRLGDFIDSIGFEEFKKAVL
ncbi:Nitrite reductase (NAD(P)H) [Archaeoglobus veneficus SNP6]|uniref:Nitrite reductase (NAD(P)H) n=2 Tax=Archaeoglobus veneficus TaxID=58290 RepID=F2KR31_ARCVS|nr:Nitrite reductase (NAD(P)H) [Archaeoglobus veneficus SNP6]